jgi:hypothetical protein
LRVQQDVGQPESAPRPDLPRRDLSPVDEADEANDADEIRTQHVEQVGCLLGGDPDILGDDPETFNAPKMVENLS